MELANPVKKAECIMNMINSELVWTGVAEVVPRDRNSSLGDADAAYVGIAALAKSEEDFRQIARSAFSEMGFDMVELDDVELIRDPDTLTNDDPDLLQKIRNLNKDAPFVYGVFHSYRNS